MKIPFSPPFIDDDIIEEVVSVLRSGWITTGPKVKALEEEVNSFTGAEASICVNSATSGLMLAMHWFGITRGDEVIIPAYTYSATALSVLHLGATPVMVDIQDDFTIDIEKIKSAITPKTKAIVPVDIAGWPCDYDAINALVNSTEIKAMFNAANETQRMLGRILILSDAAHSIGARTNGKSTALLADMTVFSFHAVKNVTTAEGGNIVINLPQPFQNKEIYALLKLMHLNGQTKDAFTKSQAGGWRYDIVLQGVKVNMPDICAAIGLGQLRKYDSYLLLERRRVFDQYVHRFSKYDWAQLPLAEDNSRTSSCHLFPLRIRGISEAQRDQMIELITATGVSVNVHFIPMPMLTLFKNKGYSIENYPNAFDNYSREISLPIYPQLTTEQIDYICESIVNAYNTVVK